MTTRSFVDTSFWVTLLSKSDEDHSRAAAWRRQITATGTPLLTTHAVLWEMANALSYRQVRRQAAAIFRRSSDELGIEVVRLTDDLEEAAIAQYEALPNFNLWIASRGLPPVVA